MARVTVEDCVMRVTNRFELVMLAAQRARNLGAGAPLSVDVDDDKNAVIALREIADGTVDLADLRDALVRGLQRVASAEEPDGDELDLSSVRAQMTIETSEASDLDEIAEDGLSVEDEAELLEPSRAEDDTATDVSPSNDEFARVGR